MSTWTAFRDAITGSFASQTASAITGSNVTLATNNGIFSPSSVFSTDGSVNWGMSQTQFGGYNNGSSSNNIWSNNGGGQNFGNGAFFGGGQIFGGGNQHRHAGPGFNGGNYINGGPGNDTIINNGGGGCRGGGYGNAMGNANFFLGSNMANQLGNNLSGQNNQNSLSNFIGYLSSQGM